MKLRKARISWYDIDKTWVLDLLDPETEEWHFSKSWKPRDIDEEDMGWVHDSILVEIRNLQTVGCDVKVCI